MPSKSEIKRINVQSGKELDDVCPDCNNTGVAGKGMTHYHCHCPIGRAMAAKYERKGEHE